MKHNYKFENKYICRLISIIFIAIIIYFNSLTIQKTYNPFVFADEMGYWTHAATFAGIDWTEISNNLTWYSFGYSFLLFPIIKFISNTVIIYRAALILNTVMQITTYILFIYIISWLFPELSKITSRFCAAAGILYTSYQINSCITWSETTLLLVSTLLIFLIIKIIDSPSEFNLFTTGLVSSYLYMIHNRTIGIVLSVVITLFFLFFFKIINKKKLLLFFISLTFGLIVNKIIRSYLESKLWLSGHSSGNNADSIISNLKIAFSSIPNLKKLLYLFFSQFFALSTGSLCMVLFVTIILINKIYTSLYRAFFSKNESLKNNTHDNCLFVFIFLICSFILTLAISSVFMYNYERIDHILYTRYTDPLIGIFIILGLVFLTDKSVYNKIICIITVPIIYILVLFPKSLIYNFIQKTDIPVFNKICAPCLSYFFSIYKYNLYEYVRIAIIIFLFVSLFSFIIKNKNLIICINSIFLILYFFYITPSALEAIYKSQDSYFESRNLIERIDSLPDSKIYAITNIGVPEIYFLQYEFHKKKLHLCDSLTTISEDGYIFADKKDLINNIDYDIIDFSNKYIVYLPTKSDKHYIPLKLLNIPDNNYYNNKTGAIYNCPNNNYLCYGPYCNIDIGQYEFVLNMTLQAFKETPIGCIEIKSMSNNCVFSHCEINSDNIGDIVIRLNTSITKNVDDMEIVIYIYNPESTQIQLNSIEVITEDYR